MSQNIYYYILYPLKTLNKRHIFQIHTQKMTLADDVNLEEFVLSKDELSGADIKAIWWYGQIAEWPNS